MRRTLHTVLPAFILFIYLLGLLIVLFLAVILFPLTVVYWIIRRQDVKLGDCPPSFTLIERYWKILAEK